MGMTIDEAIEIINHYLDYPKEEVRKALLVAINAMRKYQKIELILKDIPYGGDATVRRIQEVIEDGDEGGEIYSKDEVVAMLERLRKAVTDIENSYEKDCDNILMLAQHNAFHDGVSQVEDLIEEMMDELKEES